MGLEDRDWYREEQLDRLKNTDFFKKSAPSMNWLVIILFLVVLLFGLSQVSKYFTKLTFVSPFAKPSQESIVLPTSKEIPEAKHRPPQLQIQNVDEQQAATNTRSTASGASTIYRCKAYSGGVFWSSAYCGTQQALLDRTASVPKEMSFEQQVQLAEGLRIEALALYNQQPSPAVQKSDSCVALKRERDTIESRYTNWQWQPLEVINPDQTRMKGLRAEQSRLGCPTQ